MLTSHAIYNRVITLNNKDHSKIILNQVIVYWFFFNLILFKKIGILSI